MSALFISYTGRDPEAEAWADRLEEWCGAWGDGFFRDRHPGQGVKAGEDWRASLYRQPGPALMVISRSWVGGYRNSGTRAACPSRPAGLCGGEIASIKMDTPDRLDNTGGNDEDQHMIDLIWLWWGGQFLKELPECWLDQAS